jgi:hypothetical protein
LGLQGEEVKNPRALYAAHAMAALIQRQVQLYPEDPVMYDQIASAAQALASAMLDAGYTGETEYILRVKK